MPQGIPPKSQDLGSLFTDLDPLGTGTSKPFVDKKDFFTASKKGGMKLTGASDDSLNNVGLHLSDPFLVDPNPGAAAAALPDLNYTNSLLSSSPAVSSVSSVSASKYSDTFWSVPTPPPPVPKVHREAPHYATSARPGSGSRGHGSLAQHGNTLRVALPPEEVTRRSSSPGPGLNTQASNTYGSILELEASPRRFRKHEIPDFYSASQDSLAFNYSSGRYGGGGAEMDSGGTSLDSSLNLPPPSEPPPALPQRPPKLSSVSPPPLPPKKQPQSAAAAFSVFSQRQTAATSSASGPGAETSGGIYDFIPEVGATAAPVPDKEDDLPLFALAAMSVAELSQRLVGGELPAELRGMSLLELVEHISQGQQQQQQGDMRPSFSDNFVTKAAAAPARSAAREQDLSGGLTSLEHSGLSLHSLNSSMTSESQRCTAQPRPPSTASRVSPQPPQPPAPEVRGDGFEDDFSRFEPTSASAPGTQQQEEARGAQYDRYAVFRELQMEEEISNAWRSPTEERVAAAERELMETEAAEAGPVTGADTQAEAEPGEAEDGEAEADPYYEADHYYEAGDGGFTLPEINVQTDESTGLEDSRMHEAEESNEAQTAAPDAPPEVLTHHTKVGNGQAFIMEDQPEPPEPGAENTAFQDNFSTRFLPDVENNVAEVQSEKSGWATFEDDKAFEFSSFLSNEDQNRLLNKSPKLEKDELESFGGGWEPAFCPRSQSTDPAPAPSPRFDPFSARPGTEPPREWASAWQPEDGLSLDTEAAFPSTGSNSRGDKSQGSLRLSSDSIFNNPFADNFVNVEGGAGAEQRAVAATPPVFQLEGGGSRDSNVSRQSCLSEDFGDTQDVFDENNSFANSNFKIQAKSTKMPTSESVDIFKVSADPFDDDPFFK